MMRSMSCLALLSLVVILGGCKDGWVNHPPHAPGRPSPGDHAHGILPDADLVWKGGDPDTASVVRYDVYFGTASPPPLVSSGQPDTIYDPGPLTGLAAYYWRVVAKDDSGTTASSPVWTFVVYGRDVHPWIESKWSVSAGSHKRTRGYMSEGDSLSIRARVVQGDYVASMFCCTNLEYYKWRSGETIDPFWRVRKTKGGSWMVQCPLTDSLAFVVYNDALFSTIKVTLKVDEISWH